MSKPEFNPCILIPVYNHEQAIGQVLARVLEHGIFCILVDDGSVTSCAAELDRLAGMHPDRVVLLRHHQNQGKGAAVLSGMLYANALGYSHALQIDADGQHNTNDIPLFLELAEANPDAVVTGYPVYDRSIPSARLYGRYLTHVWVWINTLSLKIRDSMCGFRVYPVRSVVDLAIREPLRKRMAFDIDIIIRLFWEGNDIVNIPTRVSYPSDGISHFRILSDNIQISCMHAGFFLDMLARLPRLLCNRLTRRVRK